MKGHFEEQAALVAIWGLVQDADSGAEARAAGLGGRKGHVISRTTDRLPLPRVTPYSRGFWSLGHASPCNNPFSNKLPPVSAIGFVH